MKPQDSSTIVYPSRKRIILVLAIFALTLIPVSTIIDWYNQIHTQQGQAITGAVTASPQQIWNFIITNGKPFLAFFGPLILTVLLKYGLIGFVLWLLLYKLSFAESIYKKIQPVFEKTAINKTRFLIVSFLAFLVLNSLLSYTVRQHLPDNIDSVAQFFQAKLFLQGKLYTTPPPLQEFFTHPFLMPFNNKWYSLYTPAHPFFLALGLLFGMPWLVNPLLTSLSLIFIYQIAQRLYDNKTACLATTLLIVSPFATFYASGFMNACTSLFFTTLFLLYLIKSEQETKFINPFLCGLFLGGMANTRPFTGIAIAFPLAVRWFYLTWREPKNYWKKLSLIIAGSLIGITIIFTYNYLTNGDPFLFGQQAFDKFCARGVKSLGFGKSHWGTVHTVFRSIVHILNRVNQLNGQLFGWFIPSLSFIFAFWLISSKKTTWDYLHLIIISSLIFAHFFHFSFKMRYMYALLPFFTILTARGITVLSEKLPCFFKGISATKLKGSLYVLIIICFLYNVSANILPDLFSSAGKEKNQIYNMVKAQGLKNALVFVEGGFAGWGIYTRGFVHNSPTLDDEVVYALDLSEKNQQLMRHYPNRAYYSYQQKNGKGKLIKISP